MVDIVRTPQDRFTDLPGFPWESRYVDGIAVDDATVRLARIDEGSGHPVVLLHGEPTWSFLWRTVIPPLLAAGLRVVAPDHIGFGRSDKPTDRTWFSYDRLVAAHTAHLAALDIAEPVTLVVHDWGGPIGLRWAMEHSDRVARLVILDTGLYAPGGRASEAWLKFRHFVERSSTLPVSFLVDGATTRDLSDAEKAAYDAPFHVDAAHAGALALPCLVPMTDDDPGAAESWATLQALKKWTKPTLILWGGDDVILPSKIGKRWSEEIPGSVGFEELAGGHHFLQEDVGVTIGDRIATFVADT